MGIFVKKLCYISIVENSKHNYLLFIRLTLFFLVAALRPCYAQEEVKRGIDSLLARVAIAPEDTSKVDLLCVLAKQYTGYDPNTGLVVARRALQLSEQLQYDKGVAISFLGMGVNQSSRAKNDSAKMCFELALEKAKELDSKPLIGLANKHLGIACYDYNNYPEALGYFFEALLIEEELHNRFEIYLVLEYIARVYEAQKNYNKALEYYRKSNETAIAAGETKAKGKNLVNIGQVYQQMGRDDEALKCFNESLKAFTDLNDAGGVAASLADLAMVYLALHDYGKALKNNFDALAIYNKYSDRQNIAAVYECLGRTYLLACVDTYGTKIPDSLTNKKKNLQTAFDYLSRSEALCKNLSYLDGLYVTYYDMSMAYEVSGNYPDALRTFKLYVKTRDSIYSSDNNLKLTNLEIGREVALKDKELKLKKLELMKKRNENIFFALGIFFLLITTFILYRNINSQKKLNAAINKLASEQEKTIESRTEELRESNKQLLALVQFNVHNMREPLTRIMGLMNLKKDVTLDEFENTCLPMMEKAANDLDKTLKDVVRTAEETTKKVPK